MNAALSHLNSLDPTIQKRVQHWLDGPYDDKTKSLILSLLKSDVQEIIDAFYTDLTFGTAGLRGIMGVGPNRLNVYTIRKATQGIAHYLLKSYKNRPCPPVFIGFDSRHHSEEFAKETALIFAGNQIPVFLLKHLRPTPFISFGCREKKCSAAIMITASHNPKEYNGYKVYWGDGAQIVPPHDEAMMREVAAIHDLSSIKRASFPSPLITVLDDALDASYLKAIHPLQFRSEENQRFGHQLKIAYTPLHGTGITLAPKALQSWGFSNIVYVEEQINPNGDFPTVKFPNPEFKESFELGLRTLIRTQSDILIVNDPDADRTGLAVLHQGAPQILTGNEIASLCVQYIANLLKKRDALPKKAAFVTTIVSTELIKAISKSFNIACIEVLTGFKYIGEKIHQWESQSEDSYQFLFGAEESYGFLLGTVARDKDAIVTSCLLAEMALAAKLEGKTLVDHLEELYRHYGIFKEKQISVNFEGKQGAEKMASLMLSLRKHPPSLLAGQEIIEMEDYELRSKVDLLTKKEKVLLLPKSDVLVFRLKDGSKIIVRPSGTEPKIKIYTSVHQEEFTTIQEGMQICDRRLDTLTSSICKDLKI